MPWKNALSEVRAADADIRASSREGQRAQRRVKKKALLSLTSPTRWAAEGVPVQS